MTDVRKEHQAIMGQLQHLLVQALQFTVLDFQLSIHSLQFAIGFCQLLVQFCLYHIAAEYHGSCNNADQEEETQTYQHDFLRVIISQVPIYLSMQGFQIMSLTLSIPSLHQGEFGIGLGNDGGAQIVIALIRLMLQNLHSQGYHLIALGRIEIGSLEDAVTHQFQAATLGSHSIHTGIFIVALQPHLAGCHVGTPSQSVVVGKDIIKVLRLLQDALHSLDSTFFLPVSTLRCYHLDTRIRLDGIHKATMAFQGRRGTIQTTDFYDTSLTLQLLGDELTHRIADGIVIATYECRIFIRIGLAVVENHRDSLVVCTLHSLGDGTQLIRRDDEQINSLIYKLVYLLVLQHIIIIRRNQLHNERIIEILTHLQLVIEFITPDILRTLRNTNDKLLGLLATAA